MQVLRNTTSHFNQETPFDAAVFTAMGAVIAGMWLLNAIVAFLLARRRFAEAPIVWGVRLGLIAGLLGMTVAFLMVQPTPEQDALIAATAPRRSSVRTRSGLRTGDRACRSSAGAPRAAICGWRISSDCTDCRLCHSSAWRWRALVLTLAAHARSLAPGRRRGGVLDRLDASAHLAGAAGTTLIAPDALTLGSTRSADRMTAGATGAVLARAWRTGA